MRVNRVVRQEVEVPGLGERLRQARLSSERSLTQLAKDAGISRHYWYQLESEKASSGVTEDTLRRIEKILEVDLGVDFEEPVAS